MKAYSVRKAGMTRGQPHYGAECRVCDSVLAIGHLTKEAATSRAREHVAAQHPTLAKFLVVQGR